VKKLTAAEFRRRLGELQQRKQEIVALIKDENTGLREQQRLNSELRRVEADIIDLQIKIAESLAEDEVARQKATKAAENHAEATRDESDAIKEMAVEATHDLTGLIDDVTYYRSIAAGEQRRIAEEQAEREKELAREVLEERKRIAATYLQTMSSIMSSVTQIMSNSSQARLNRLDAYYDRERDRIENSMLSDEEKYQRLQELDEERERRTKEIQRQQAIRERNMALFQIAIQTAVAVVEALPNIFKVAMVLAMGAAQAAAVATQPLPQLDEGGMLVRDQIVQAHANELIAPLPGVAAAIVDDIERRGGLGAPGGMPRVLVLRIGSREFDAFVEGEIDNGRIKLNPRSMKR